MSDTPAPPPSPNPGEPAPGPGRRAHAAAHSRSAHPAHIRPRRWPRRILVTTNILVLLGIVAVAAAYGYVQWRLDQIHRVHVAGLVPQGHSDQSKPDGSNIAPFTLLIVGSDTRNLPNGKQYGAGLQGTAGQRSDSIILLRVVPKTGSLAILSIPRDTLAPVPGYGVTRVNAAFNSGNPALLIQVLSEDFGIQVNHYAEANFDTFQDLAEAVGGIEQWFPAPARDIETGLSIPAAGCYNLNGTQALAFVRSREYQYELHGEWYYQLSPESDLARIQRQQAFVKAVAQKAKTIAPTNPIALNNLIGSITKNLTVDSGFSNSLLLSLGQIYRTAKLTNIPEFTYPTVNSTSVSGALDPLKTQGAQMVAQWLNSGEPSAEPTTTTTKPSKHKSVTTAASTTTSTSIDPATVGVVVVNGTGVSHQASTAAQDLIGLGYHAYVSVVREPSVVQTTEIEYAPDSLADATQLQAQLASRSTLVENAALTPTAYNLELVTGANFTGVKGSPTGSASSSSTSTSSTTLPASSGTTATNQIEPDASSFVNGQYIPPGRVAGQATVNCGL